jgi:transposase
VWDWLHCTVLDQLGQHDLLDWSRAAIDSVSVRAKRKSELTGPSPTDRGTAGTKYHVLCDRTGLPLHTMIIGATAHDSTMLAPLFDTNPRVREHRGHPGRPRRRPDKLHADKGYDYPRCRRYLHRRGIKVQIARRGIEDTTRLGRVRWVVERTMSWLLGLRRLALRYDRTEATVSALLTLACTLICRRRLPPQPR